MFEGLRGLRNDIIFRKKFQRIPQFSFSGQQNLKYQEMNLVNTFPVNQTSKISVIVLQLLESVDHMYQCTYQNSAMLRNPFWKKNTEILQSYVHIFPFSTEHSIGKISSEIRE
jgi:hypothetical protein